MNAFSHQLYRWLEEPSKSRFSYWLNVTIYLLIVFSVVVLMLSTVAPLQDEYGRVFDTINRAIMLFFTVEYVARVYAAGARSEYRGLIGRLRYMRSAYALIDLLAILPYLLSAFNVSSVFVRALRLLRIFRLFRMRKYAVFAVILFKIIRTKKEEFLLLLFYTLVLMVILSFVIYELEHDAQPDVFTNVVQTLWWAVATLTTVGYGDMYPVTAAGQLITAVISLLGIAFIAIPGGIFASEFITEFSKSAEHSDRQDLCVRCGSEKLERLGPCRLDTPEPSTVSGELVKCGSCGFHWIDHSPR